MKCASNQLHAHLPPITVKVEKGKAHSRYFNANMLKINLIIAELF